MTQTIGKVTISRNSNNKVILRVKDDVSRETICEASFDLTMFGLLMSGMSEIPCSLGVSYNPERVGKEKILERPCINIETPKGDYVRNFLDKGAKGIAEVQEHFEANYNTDIWKIWDDGLSSQQRPQKHQYIVYKYIDADMEKEYAEYNAVIQNYKEY